jgi:hypothetical protein
MGFMDTVKGLAADAERAGKVTAAQARLVVLQNDLKKAERELGHAAYALVERGELDHPDLAHTIERLRATGAEVRAKEAEIAGLRRETAPATPATDMPEPPATTDDAERAAPAANVQTPYGPATVTSKPPATAEPAAAAGPAKTASSAGDAVTEAPAKRAATKSTTRKAPAKRAAASAAATKKAGTKKVAPATPRRGKGRAGAGAAGGATPKKPSRPSSSGPRPAGKKRPGGS